jgi:uncharacterized protein YprB with RNaseH-like and TPR domain
MEEAQREATVAALRGRIAQLGGLGRHPRARAPVAIAAVDCPSPDPHRSGFVPEYAGAGSAWIRRVTVDLAPFLDRAAGALPATRAQLLALAYGMDLPAAEHGFLRSGLLDPDMAVVDIETIGLRGSGVLAFLVGVGVPRGRRLDIDQLLLADPGEEAALLDALRVRLCRTRLFVTYNGRTFDLPVLRARCIVNRCSPDFLEGRLHCDLLAPVRRLFRHRLGACTLRQAELDLLGLTRDGDTPGFEAPGRYRAWLRGAGPEVFAGVVRHNQLDLCATMVLAARLAAHVEGRLVEPVHPADRYHLAVHLERRGAAESRDDVDGHYRAAYSARCPPWDGRAGHRLAARLRRCGLGATGEALHIWGDLWERNRLDLRAARSLAVALERGGRLLEARDVCRIAVNVCEAMPPWRLALLKGAPTGGWVAAWHRRADRLDRRLEHRALDRREQAARPASGARAPAKPELTQRRSPRGVSARPAPARRDQSPPGVLPPVTGAVVCPPLFAY